MWRQLDQLNAHHRNVEAKLRAGYRAQRQTVMAAREARRERRTHHEQLRAAGVWDADAAWPAEWDKLWAA